MATGTQLEKSAPASPGQPQLTDRLAGLWGRGRVRWSGMQAAQRNWAVAAALMLAALAVRNKAVQAYQQVIGMQF